MTIYFDGVRLGGTNLRELHKVAKENGLEIGWFRGGADPQHYQVPPDIIGSVLTDQRVYVVPRGDFTQLTRGRA